ncbi:hypothetical protein SAMN05444277_1222 [Parafilimonas terrae]|uniref:Uncharacterized protein n=1 Tax=Parafilimonas terrae TaxID=1465490 RepID=A0A1I5ZF12_9BACT|nr:hypothetical protein SAMN05444277_1222 [Parafilimonas terrae]
MELEADIFFFDVSYKLYWQQSFFESFECFSFQTIFFLIYVQGSKSVSTFNLANPHNINLLK